MEHFFALLPLPPVAEASGVYYAFLHSDGVGQGIVILLSLMSVATWTLMLEKGIGLKRAYTDSRRFIEEFRAKKNPLGMRDRAIYDISPVARIFDSGYQRIALLHGGEDAMRRDGRRVLNETELEVVRAALEETVGDQIVRLEDKSVVLMTAVSVSPFLGLFGTVWGIMLAFTAMAIQGRPDVSTLAPGVSGALLTTVLGLLVAIPSLIGYNAIVFYIKQTTVHMDNFTEEFIAKLKIEQIERLREMEK